MHMPSFTMKAVTLGILLVLFATPFSAFAEFTATNYEQLIYLQALQDAGTIDEDQAAQLQQLLILQQLQGQQGSSNGNSALQNYALLQALNGANGDSNINPALLSMAMLGGGTLGNNNGGNNGGVFSQIGQGLSLGGMLSGNIGLTMIGMIMSMLGGLGGATPQRGPVDEQYVAPGQAGPNKFGGKGSAADSPYYTAPASKQPQTSTASTCKQSLFLVKDTTTNPVITKAYPSSITVAKDECVLAINSDDASHSVQAKQQGKNDVAANQQIASKQSHVFRFSSRNTYSLCVDSGTTCTTVTVQ